MQAALWLPWPSLNKFKTCTHSELLILVSSYRGEQGHVSALNLETHFLETTITQKHPRSIASNLGKEHLEGINTEWGTFCLVSFSKF